MRARRRRDGLRGDASGTAVQRIRRSLAAEHPRLHVAKIMGVRWLTCTEERLLHQHRLRPCSRIDGCRRGLHLQDRVAVGSTTGRDRYRGRC